MTGEPLFWYMGDTAGSGAYGARLEAIHNGTGSAACPFDSAEETIQIAEGILGKEIIDTEQEDVLRGKSDIEEKLKKEWDRYNMLYANE